MKVGIVVSVVVVDGDKLLMVQEGKPESYQKWNIPSGRLEEDETILQAARREGKEETGYHIELTGLTGVYRFVSETKTPLIRFSFAGRVVGGKLHCDGKEILMVKWFSQDEIKRIPDSQIWNAQSVRTILSDFYQGYYYPLEAIRE